MAPHSSTLAWKIPWMEEPGKLQSMGSRRVGYDWATSLSLFTFMHWKCNPLQCSCLENPRDGGVWWAAVYGVTQSRTQLKWLSSSSSSMHLFVQQVLSVRLMLVIQDPWTRFEEEILYGFFHRNNSHTEMIQSASASGIAYFIIVCYFFRCWKNKNKVLWWNSFQSTTNPWHFIADGKTWPIIHF